MLVNLDDTSPDKFDPDPAFAAISARKHRRISLDGRFALDLSAVRIQLACSVNERIRQIEAQALRKLRGHPTGEP